ncbi:hypothetical protein NDU88_002330, partial [Pleurodeles waltl]
TRASQKRQEEGQKKNCCLWERRGCLFGTAMQRATLSFLRCATRNARTHWLASAYRNIIEGQKTESNVGRY